MRTISLTELRAVLTPTVLALSDGPVIVLRHSRPAAVLMDYGEYMRLVEAIER